VAARVLSTVQAQGAIMNPPPQADGLLALREIVAASREIGRTRR
jgi:hypothetical protein